MTKLLIFHLIIVSGYDIKDISKKNFLWKDGYPVPVLLKDYLQRCHCYSLFSSIVNFWHLLCTPSLEIPTHNNNGGKITFSLILDFVNLLIRVQVLITLPPGIQTVMKRYNEMIVFENLKRTLQSKTKIRGHIDILMKITRLLRRKCFWICRTIPKLLKIYNREPGYNSCRQHFST